jgi:hypothetical protein
MKARIHEEARHGVRSDRLSIDRGNQRTLMS